MTLENTLLEYGELPREAIPYTLPGFYFLASREMRGTYCRARLAAQANDELAFPVMRECVRTRANACSDPRHGRQARA